jgi:pimeloyl-ACP methyl ester carboxylesterase
MTPTPGGVVELADGRRLAYDDVGDPDGRPIVFLHGCPGSRLSRHPDDTIAARLGVRLLSVDRPGYGASDPSAGDELAQADDVLALIDALELDRVAALGWSSGGPVALAIASRNSPRVATVGVACGQPALAADPGDQTPAEFARIAAPFIATPGMSLELAREAAVEGMDAQSLADLASVDGLYEQLALTLVAAVERGLAGLERDLRAMATPWPFALASISCPVTLWYAERDHAYPPEVGERLAAEIPNARLEIIEGATHLLPLVRWSTLLGELALATKEKTCR